MQMETEKKKKKVITGNRKLAQEPLQVHWYKWELCALFLCHNSRVVSTKQLFCPCLWWKSIFGKYFLELQTWVTIRFYQRRG